MPNQTKATPNTEKNANTETDIWNSYWQGPRLTCSLSGPGIGYIQPVVDTWRDFFKTLKDGIRLLDIATGNGAIAIIANDTAGLMNRRFEIHAIDQADIDPATHLQGTGLSVNGIIFHPHTPAEVTGFPDAYFDVVTGQFALEYTDICTTIVEMARILKSGGIARFIMHMRDSEIFRQTKRQLHDIDFVQNKLQLLQKARVMMTTVYMFEQQQSADKKSFQDAQQARNTYLQAAKIIDRAVPSAAYKEIYVAILKMVAYHWEHRKQLSLEQFLVRANAMETEIANAEKRHAMMCDRSVDAIDMEKIRGHFESSGFTNILINKLRVRVGMANGEVGWDVLLRLV